MNDYLSAKSNAKTPPHWINLDDASEFQAQCEFPWGNRPRAALRANPGLAVATRGGCWFSDLGWLRSRWLGGGSGPTWLDGGLAVAQSRSEHLASGEFLSHRIPSHHHDEGESVCRPTNWTTARHSSWAKRRSRSQAKSASRRHC